MGQDGWAGAPEGGAGPGARSAGRTPGTSITLDDLPVPTAVLRPDWTYVWVSAAYAALLGARPEELLYRYADELVVPAGELHGNGLSRLLPGDVRAVPRLVRVRDPRHLGRALFQLFSAVHNAAGDVCYLLVQALLVRDGDAVPLHELPPIRPHTQEETA